MGKFGNGETPETTQTKGDKFVGNYYVEFDKELKRQVNIIYEDFRKNSFETFDTNKKDEVFNLNNKINPLEIQKENYLMVWIIAKFRTFILSLKLN